FVISAGARADASEIETHGRHAALAERLSQHVHDFGRHRAAVDWMRMTDDGHARAIRVGGCFQQRFEVPGGAGDREALSGGTEQIRGHLWAILYEGTSRHARC